MKKYLLLGVVYALLCGNCSAQNPPPPPEFTFKLTNEEVGLIWDALSKEPFGKVVNLVGKLRQQAIEQQQAQQSKPPIVGPVKPVEPEKK